MTNKSLSYFRGVCIGFSFTIVAGLCAPLLFRDALKGRYFNEDRERDAFEHAAEEMARDRFLFTYARLGDKAYLSALDKLSKCFDMKKMAKAVLLGTYDSDAESFAARPLEWSSWGTTIRIIPLEHFLLDGIRLPPDPKNIDRIISRACTRQGVTETSRKIHLDPGDASPVYVYRGNYLSFCMAGGKSFVVEAQSQSESSALNAIRGIRDARIHDD